MEKCKEGAPWDKKAYNIGPGRLRPRILLIVGQYHYITAIVTEFL